MMPQNGCTRMLSIDNVYMPGHLYASTFTFSCAHLWTHRLMYICCLLPVGAGSSHVSVSSQDLLFLLSNHTSASKPAAVAPNTAYTNGRPQSAGCLLIAGLSACQVLSQQRHTHFAPAKITATSSSSISKRIANAVRSTPTSPTVISLGNTKTRNRVPNAKVRGYC